jgi:S-DNA-T family DNA segregation ATPase FtsK/SpoIIIE
MAKKSKKKTELTIHSKETRILLGIILLIVGISILVAPFLEGEGLIFPYITDLLGITSVSWGILIIILAGRIITDNKYLSSNKTLIGALLLAFVSNIFFSFWIPESEFDPSGDYSGAGGLVGSYLHFLLKGFMGKFIEFIVLIVLLIISFSLLSGVSMETITGNLVEMLEKVLHRGKGTLNRSSSSKENEDIFIDGIQGDKTDQGETLDRKSYVGEKGNEDIIASEIEDSTEAASEVVEPQNEELEYVQNSTSSESLPQNKQSQVEEVTETLAPPQFMNWQLPPSALLKKPEVTTPDKKIHKRNATIIEKTLRSFNIESRTDKITIGPTVVQYALSITVGTKVSKVRNLSNDLALALATPESQIRIEAPIPGTSLIGIEIPNPEPNFVYIKEMVEALNTEVDKYQLPLLLGKNIRGQCIIQDLAKLPHLLVAGATGTGKSVGINTILTGFLATKSPDELKLILVDPKMVELAPYNGIPHLLTPVITDMDLVVNALQWAVEEMLRRYRILKQLGARNISEFNEKSDEANLPFIVIIIDEMADLMLSTGVDVESKIVRLAQMARAVGIHLILATQRPSVDVITGLIKANVPGRVAFSVSTSIDSRVIIDQTGAETLIGKGDMMFKSPSTGSPLRLQCAWTDTPDTENIVNFIKQQVNDEVSYSHEITKPKMDVDEKSASNGGHSEDDMFKDAVMVVVGDQKASASMLQRRLRIGYNRAARLIDELEEAGAIGPQEGSKPRKVLISSADQLIGNPTPPPSDNEFMEGSDFS